MLCIQYATGILFKKNQFVEREVALIWFMKPLNFAASVPIR